MPDDVTNDGAPEVQESSAEKAFEMFTGTEADATGDSSAGADPVVQDDAAQADPAVVADAAEPQALTEEQLASDPRYQELAGFQDAMKPVMEQFGVPDAKELTAQLSDSQVLYDIMSGKGTPSALLDVMASNVGWNDQQKSAIAQDLIGWLNKNGYLKEGAAPKAGEAKFNDPLTERFAKLEKTLADRDQSAQQERVQAHQAEVFQRVESKVAEFCKSKGLDSKEDVGYYLSQIASLVNGNKAVIGRIEKGNFVDVQQLFAKVHNAEVARLTRHTEAQTKAQGNKAKNPRIPAGGAPPAPAAQAKRSLKTSDQRIAAATDAWNQS